MTWLIFAFAAPVLWAISTHIDKYVVDRYVPRGGGVAVLVVFTSAIGLLVAPAVWLLVPGSLALPSRAIMLIVASGALSMAAMFFYLGALQNEEASVVVPWFQLIPLFGAVLGYGLLGEALTPRQLFGGAAIVAGAGLLSLNTGRHSGTFKPRLAMLMLASAFMLALSTVILKLFAVHDEFWSTTAWTGVGQAAFGMLLLLRAPTRRQLKTVLHDSARTVLTVNEAINLAGSLTQRYALVLAPLSLVQAISGTGPLFVFLLGIGLSLIRPSRGHEDLSVANLLQRAAAALLVALGVGFANQ